MLGRRKHRSQRVNLEAARLLDAEHRAARIPHALVMGLAVVLAHILRFRLKKHPEAGPALPVAATAGPFLLILLGLWVLGVKS